MPKRFIFLLLILAWLLAACGGGSKSIRPEATQTESATEVTQALPAPSETNRPEPTASATGVAMPVTTATLEAPELASEQSGCTVVSPFPTPGPTLQSIFPPVGEDDWTRGPVTASVTIIEYSDFQ